MNDSSSRASALMDLTARPAAVMQRGQGSWLYDTDGRRYLDFVQGWAVNSLGHCPPVVAEALAAQSRRLISPSPAYHNEAAIALADALVANSPFDQVFLCSSGAEANEGAIKLARRWGVEHRGGAYEIITFDDAFHGRTLATMAASGKPQFRGLFEPQPAGFVRARFNDIESVRARIGERTVAVMIEPIQGEAGVVPARADFLRDLRALTDAHDLLLIVDEIQTGVGRTGDRWGFEHAGIRPDVMTIGKGIGGGVPLAALLATHRAACFRHGDQGGTYAGNPLMAAVGKAVLDQVFAPAFLAGVRSRGRRLAEGLTALSDRHALGEVRGRGLLWALDLVEPIGAELVSRAFDTGLLLNAPRPHLLRLMPALNVGDDEIERMLSMLDAALGSLPSKRQRHRRISASATNEARP
ncbi:MAG: acetylornithine transaminase [Burkholderiaceae bacterium]